MFQREQKTGWLIIGVALCLAPGAFADCSATSTTPTIGGTACMTLTSAGPYTMGNVYVGPYTAYINGSTTPTSVICDDFLDDSFIPEYWTADIFSGSGITPASQTRMAQVTTSGAYPGIPKLTPDQMVQAYNEVGYLALQLLSAQDQTTAGEIHFAMWAVFDPNALTYLDNFYGDGNAFYTAAKQNYYDPAMNYKDNSSFISQFTIYSPDQSQQISCSSSGALCSATPPQEFLVKTPEPSFVALLGVDLSGVGAVFFFLRRRRSDRS